MSADVLREAAALMRARAEAATPGPWWPYERFSYTGVWASDSPRGRGRQVGSGRTEANAAHIASWHPAVALAVADWLESVAGSCVPPPPESALDVVDAGRTICEKDYEHALAVATAYLGRDA